MPTSTHEAWAEMVRADPAVAAKLLGGLLDVTVPAFVSAHLESADLTQLHPTEFHADAVVALVDDDGEPALAVVVEVQRGCDTTKSFTWPVYLATVRSRLKCHTVLVVLAPDEATARWCAHPIDMGHPEWVLKPLVVGPAQIPVVAGPEQVRQDPWLAVFSCLAHHEDEDERDVTLKALLEGTKSLDEDEVSHYIDVLVGGLSELALKHLEELMTTGTFNRRPVSEVFRRHYDKGVAEGKAEGEAKAILSFLVARGLKVPATARDRIMSCTDAGQRSEWVQRAATVRHVDDLFA